MTHQSLSALLFAAVCATLAAGACGGSADDASPESDAGPSANIADAAASRDGSVVQCQADHQESLEERNDRIINEANQVEPTGLVLARQDGFSICGQLDPAQASGDFADVDVYEFAVSGEQPARIVLTLDESADLGDVQLLLLGADGPTTISEAMRIGDTGLTHRVIPAGTYWVAVLAKAPIGNVTIPYQIHVRPESINCDDEATAADYIESLDGQDHRGNDTLEIDYERSSSFSETSYGKDAPEPTNIVLAAGEQASIRGSVADVAALDDFRDRDAFLVRTGPETRELSIRGAWQHNSSVDLDIHVFRAGVPGLDLSFRGAATVGTGSDELATMGVEADSEYWIWVGAYDNSQPELPLDYNITLCASDL